MSSAIVQVSGVEYEVSQILVQLPQLIYESELRSKFAFTWGSKRKRSVLVDSNPTRLLPISSSPSPFIQSSCAAENSSESEDLPMATVKVGASSPSTPLSFLPSESDDKPKHLKTKLNLKRKKEEWLEIIEGLTQRRELLKGELGNVRHYYDKLKALNSELKARKQAISLRLEREKTDSEIAGLNLELAPPMVKHQTAQISAISENFQDPSSSQMPSVSRLSTVSHSVSPLGIPDLNVPANESLGLECSQPFDMEFGDNNKSRAIAAARARQNRIRIYRLKNPISAIKQRHLSKS